MFLKEDNFLTDRKLNILYQMFLTGIVDIVYEDLNKQFSVGSSIKINYFRIDKNNKVFQKDREVKLVNMLNSVFSSYQGIPYFEEQNPILEELQLIENNIFIKITKGIIDLLYLKY